MATADEGTRHRVAENENHSWRALTICMYGLASYYGFSGKMDLTAPVRDNNRVWVIILLVGPLAMTLHALYQLRQGKHRAPPFPKFSRWVYYGMIGMSLLFYLSLLYNFFLR
jgi:hypothetical protein